jgi:hypothetical protein
MRASVLDQTIGTCSGQKEEGDGAKHSRVLKNERS